MEHSAKKLALASERWNLKRGGNHWARSMKDGECQLSILSHCATVGYYTIWLPSQNIFHTNCVHIIGLLWKRNETSGGFTLCPSVRVRPNEIHCLSRNLYFVPDESINNMQFMFLLKFI